MVTAIPPCFIQEKPYSKYPYSLTFKYAVDTLRAAVPLLINQSRIFQMFMSMLPITIAIVAILLAVFFS